MKKINILEIFLFGALGYFLASIGLGIFNYKYWVIMIIVALLNIIGYYDGYDRGGE
jgi:hypothetical protein